MPASPGSHPRRTRSTDLGLQQFRVRAHGTVARIEVAEEDAERAWSMRARIAEAVRAAGFAYAAFDLDGYRSGSMNEVLAASERESATR